MTVACWHILDLPFEQNHLLFVISKHDLCCEDGRSLHCLELFGRQLICALHGLHPLAVLAFAEGDIAKAA